MSIHAPSEVESTLQRLSQHRGVRGVMILSNDTGRVIQHTGVIFEAAASTVDETSTVETVQRSGSDDHDNSKDAVLPTNNYETPPLISATVRKYADAARRIVAATKDAVQSLDEEDALRFLRMRTGKYEMMITPEAKYTLVVLHDPSSV